MTREEADALIADLMAEHFARLSADLEARIDRAVAAKPLPPFVPPPVWSEGRHGAGAVVRHRNGIFLARFDSVDEPPSDAWLPLVVGLASFDMKWTDDRTFTAQATLSDGRIVETARVIAVPLVRGHWHPETTYLPGDRVFRFGEWHATAMSLGVDPSTADAEGPWEKVGGKYAKSVLALAIDDEGTVSESGREIGSIKPLVQGLLTKLVNDRAA